MMNTTLLSIDFITRG